MDEERRSECKDYLKLINEVEAEREESKYYKNKIRTKLLKVNKRAGIAKNNFENLCLIWN